MHQFASAMFTLTLGTAVSLASADDHSQQVTLKGGGTGYNAVPVSVAWSGNDLDEQTPVCVHADDQRLPGQVERVDDSTRVWFLADVPANESRQFTLHAHEDCADSRAFQWQRDDEATDLLFDGRSVLQYDHPIYNPDDHHDTMKPFHQVYAPDGQRFITKGLDGLYDHHRGIFFGYNQIHVGDDTWDTWHGGDGARTEHLEVLDETAGPVFADHTVLLHWVDGHGEPFAEETRRLRAFRQPEGQLLIDFHTELRTLAGEIALNGDLQHAGVQFRAAQAVADDPSESRFLRPEAFADHPADEEYPANEAFGFDWNAFQFTIDSDRYTVAYFPHPANPGDAQMSERRYGRFGEFFPYVLTDNRPLRVHYRFWVLDGDDVDREQVESHYRAYADTVRQP